MGTATATDTAPTATEVSPRARPALNGAAGAPDVGVAATAFTDAGLRYRQFGMKL